MRNEKTPWNRTYLGPMVDTTEAFARELVSRRREQGRSEKQQAIKRKWDKSFELRQAEIRPARQVHPDDLAIGLSRRHAEEKQEDRELKAQLREVWE